MNSLLCWIDSNCSIPDARSTRSHWRCKPCCRSCTFVRSCSSRWAFVSESRSGKSQWCSSCKAQARRCCSHSPRSWDKWQSPTRMGSLDRWWRWERELAAPEAFASWWSPRIWDFQWKYQLSERHIRQRMSIGSLAKPIWEEYYAREQCWALRQLWDIYSVFQVFIYDLILM